MKKRKHEYKYTTDEVSRNKSLRWTPAVVHVSDRTSGTNKLMFPTNKSLEFHADQVSLFVFPNYMLFSLPQILAILTANTVLITLLPENA